MLTRRIIPCLDVKDGEVVKGVRFRDHVVVGDIVELALRYRDEGADELVFYDIGASPAGRTVASVWVERVSRELDIPFCVAGGIRSVADARVVLQVGADKISVNSAALERPALIGELADAFGVQCVVVGIDSLRDADGEWRVRQYTGDPARTRELSLRTLDWIDEVQQRGAGEIVLNCMGSDGVRQGYDIEQLRAARAHCRVPLVASGGAGTCDHFREVFADADVDGALAASVFHSGDIAIPELKQCLRSMGVQVRVYDDGTGFPPPTKAFEGRLCAGMTNGEVVVNVNFDAGKLDWAKGGDLLPAIVQHWQTGEVLMLGYMNAEALAETRRSGRVTFFSRGKQRLWMKGESSGHVLMVKSIRADCDRDTLLVNAEPHGPTCHLGTTSCFGDGAAPPLAFLAQLDVLIAARAAQRPQGSYSTKLFDAGLRRIAQKLGEEGVETALAAVADDNEALLGESADLVYHLIVLLRARGLALADVAAILARRHAVPQSSGEVSVA